MLNRHCSIKSSVVAFVIVMIPAALAGCGRAPTEKDDHRSDREAAVAEVDEAESLQATATTSELPPEPVKILDVSTSGNGCPEDTVAVNISPDNAAFTALFAEFQIAVESANKTQRVSRNCQVNLDVELPKGWQVSVATITTRGYAEIPKGATARLETKLQFVGTHRGKTVRDTIFGPYADNFTVGGTVKLRHLKWSPCGGKATLGIDVKATVKAKKGQEALLQMDSLDGELTQDLGLRYRRCK